MQLHLHIALNTTLIAFPTLPVLAISSRGDIASMEHPTPITSEHASYQNKDQTNVGENLGLILPNNIESNLLGIDSNTTIPSSFGSSNLRTKM